MGYFCELNEDLEKKPGNIHLFINDEDRVHLIYERIANETGLSRWNPLYFSDGDFDLNAENITVLSDNILSISIEGLKTSKNVGEIWLMYKGEMVRHRTDKTSHRLHWIKLTYVNNFKKGDKLTVGFNGIGNMQVTIMGL